MPFVPAPNIVSVEVRAILDLQHIENRFTIDALAPVTAALTDDITNLVSVWAQEHYFPLLPHNVQLTEVVGTDLTTQDSFQHTITPSGTVVGGVAANALPNEVSLAISLRTGNRGRSARGRSYVLALPTDEVSGNNVASAFAALHVAAFQQLVTVMNDNSHAWSIVSYRLNNAPRPGGPVYFPITTCLVTDLVVDSMRRRKPGVGS